MHQLLVDPIQNNKRHHFTRQTPNPKLGDKKKVSNGGTIMQVTRKNAQLEDVTKHIERRV